MPTSGASAGNPASARSTPRGRAPRERRELEAERHHADAVRGCDPHRDQVGLDALRHRDEAVGPVGQEALDRAEDGARDAPEILAQHVTVVGVHDDRDAREARGDAAQDSGLGRVGVDDVRAEAAREAHEADEGAQVGERTDLPSEPGQRLHVDMPLQRQIHAGSLPAPTHVRPRAASRSHGPRDLRPGGSRGGRGHPRSTGRRRGGYGSLPNGPGEAQPSRLEGRRHLFHRVAPVRAVRKRARASISSGPLEQCQQCGIPGES